MVSLLLFFVLEGKLQTHIMEKMRLEQATAEEK
jgi:hypothetical protein